MASLTGLVQAASSSAVRGDGFKGWGIYRLLYCGANASQLASTLLLLCVND